jgi:predicted kinase
MARSTARAAAAVLVCGLPGSGKTTTARRLSVERNGVRLCPDEWMRALGIDLFDDATRADVERLQWALAKDILSAGVTVVIEWGTWARAERDEVRETCRALGVGVELVYLDVPLDVLWARVSARNEQPDEPVIERDALLRWSIEDFEAPTPDELALFDRSDC